MSDPRETQPLHRWTGAARTLGELAGHRARQDGGRTAFVEFADDPGAELRLGHAELDHTARRLAATLRRRVRPGEPVLLVCAPGREFLFGLFGILHAGAVAVPTYPPDLSRAERTLPRLARIAVDCGARVAVTDAASLAPARALAAGVPGLAGLDFIATDELGEAIDTSPREPDDLAFLQYTSGSTGEPRGVALSHANVLANLELIHEGVAQRPDSSGVLWLPPYHDMGLLNLLYALAVGFPCVLMSPQQFVAQPLRWLTAMTRHRATYSGGPNFAYDLCVRKISAEQRAPLDLSAWEVAFNGAEPVRAGTLARFEQAFAPHGFRRRAFLACYGLAEFTVAVAGGSLLASPTILGFDREALRGGRAVLAEPDADPTLLVGCGRPRTGHGLRIVDPLLRVALPAGLVGEVWAAGPSMAQGYHGRPAETDATFRVPLADDPALYLRTGDLGFVHGGELYVVGRRKDLIVIRGKNHAPQDLERSAESASPSLRPGATAAFGVDVDGEEQLVLCCEAEPSAGTDGPAIAAAIRQRVAQEHQVEVARVLLLPRGGLPRTPNGKLQRQAMRERSLQGTHGAWAVFHARGADADADVVAASDAAPPVRADEGAAASPVRAGEGAATPVRVGEGAAATPEQIERWLLERVAAACGAPIAPQASIAAAGLDSLGLLELAEDLGTWLGRPVAHTFAWEHPSLRAAAHALAQAPSPWPEAAVGAVPRRALDAEANRFYQRFAPDEDRSRTNVHYEVPARFFEVMTGGRWQIYSCNLWSGIAAADPTDPEHQTLAQEHKLDTFARLIGARPGLRVLEVGCAQGGALRYLARRYGVVGHGIALSPRQIDYARQQARALGVDVRYELCHWEDMRVQGQPFDAVISDEVIVHFQRLEQFFGRAFGWLADGGVMVHKEVHFTHPGYGDHMDRLAVLANDIFGGTGNYRTLAEELDLHHRAGFHVDSVLEIPRSDYALTARSWYENLRRREHEMVALVGPERYLQFLKWIAWVQLGPGGQSQDLPIMSTHFVRSLKAPASLRRRLGIKDPVSCDP